MENDKPNYFDLATAWGWTRALFAPVVGLFYIALIFGLGKHYDIVLIAFGKQTLATVDRSVERRWHFDKWIDVDYHFRDDKGQKWEGNERVGIRMKAALKPQKLVDIRYLPISPRISGLESKVNSRTTIDATGGLVIAVLFSLQLVYVVDQYIRQRGGPTESAGVF